MEYKWCTWFCTAPPHTHPAKHSPPPLPRRHRAHLVLNHPFTTLPRAYHHHPTTAACNCSPASPTPHRTWFSTTHLRPCSHSNRGGPAGAAAPPAALGLLPGAAPLAAVGAAAGTAPLRSARFLLFISSAAEAERGTRGENRLGVAGAVGHCAPGHPLVHRCQPAPPRQTRLQHPSSTGLHPPTRHFLEPRSDGRPLADVSKQSSHRAAAAASRRRRCACRLALCKQRARRWRRGWRRRAAWLLSCPCCRRCCRCRRRRAACCCCRCPWPELCHWDAGSIPGGSSGEVPPTEGLQASSERGRP